MVSMKMSQAYWDLQNQVIAIVLIVDGLEHREHGCEPGVVIHTTWPTKR
jgi:hypothetical protein